MHRHGAADIIRTAYAIAVVGKSSKEREKKSGIVETDAQSMTSAMHDRVDLQV